MKRAFFDDLREGLSEAIDYELGELPARKTTLTIISEAEKEYAATGVLMDAREALPSLRRKHFG